ncbi:hypothetical protein [Planobispora rosea]|nr:hypothetical protein [Planobispora rosea]
MALICSAKAMRAFDELVGVDPGGGARRVHLIGLWVLPRPHRVP